MRNRHSLIAPDVRKAILSKRIIVVGSNGVAFASMSERGARPWRRARSIGCLPEVRYEDSSRSDRRCVWTCIERLARGKHCGRESWRRARRTTFERIIIRSSARPSVQVVTAGGGAFDFEATAADPFTETTGGRKQPGRRLKFIVAKLRRFGEDHRRRATVHQRRIHGIWPLFLAAVVQHGNQFVPIPCEPDRYFLVSGL